MIPKGATIIGLRSVTWAADEDGQYLAVQLLLSDGRIAATWWPAAVLARSASVVAEAHGAPFGASLQ